MAVDGAMVPAAREPVREPKRARPRRGAVSTVAEREAEAAAALVEDVVVAGVVPERLRDAGSASDLRGAGVGVGAASAARRRAGLRARTSSAV
jgi:hypothetical protein